MNWISELWRDVTQHNRHDEDECSAKERSGQATETADNNYEENEKAQVDVEHRRLGASVPEENQKSPGDTAVKRGCRKCQKLGRQKTYAGEFSREIHVAHRHPHSSDPAVHQI